jgi:hypothetical protein
MTFLKFLRRNFSLFLSYSFVVGFAGGGGLFCVCVWIFGRELFVFFVLCLFCFWFGLALLLLVMKQGSTCSPRLTSNSPSS